MRVHLVFGRWEEGVLKGSRWGWSGGALRVRERDACFMGEVGDKLWKTWARWFAQFVEWMFMEIVATG